MRTNLTKPMKLTWLGWLAEKAFEYRGQYQDFAFEVGVYLDVFDKALKTARTIIEDMRSDDGAAVDLPEYQNPQLARFPQLA